MGEVERTVAGWILEEPLGAGGYGQVWRARRRHVDLVRAVKVIPLVDERTFDSWRHEIVRLEALDHPNIVRFYDADIVADGGIYHGHAWIATELCEQSLADELRDPNRPRPTEAGCEALVEQMLGALATAHEGASVHRDVKPANILRHSSGAWKLCDFGTARLIPHGEDHPRTQVVGTSPYMSPRALRGQQDQAADLYALGVTVHEMLTGERLHPRPSSMGDVEYIQLILDTPPHIGGQLPERWQTVVKALIAADGIDRSADELDQWFRDSRGHTAPPGRRHSSVTQASGHVADNRATQLQPTLTAATDAQPEGEAPPSFQQMFVPAPSPQPAAQQPPARPVQNQPSQPAPGQQQADQDRWRPTQVSGRRMTAFVIDSALVWFIATAFWMILYGGLLMLVYNQPSSDEIGPDQGLYCREQILNDRDCRIFQGDGNVYVGDGNLWSSDRFAVLFTAVTVLALFVFRQGSRGTTPGKRVTGIRVMGPDGGPPGRGRALARTLLLVVDVFAWPAMLLNVHTNEEDPQAARRARRRLGDRAAGTWVVRHRAHH